MSEQDWYFTIQKPATAEHKERGSRFIAYAFPIKNIPEAKDKLGAVKKEHSKASHYCFAYRLGLDGNTFRASDDGEPSGTAGKPILGQIDSRKLADVMIVVVRYFGGTLLGVSGLIQAYKTAASLVLQLTPVVQKPVVLSYRLSFDYTLLNDVMLVVKQHHCIVEQQEAGLFCTLQVNIPKASLEQVLRHLHDMPTVEIVRL